MTDRRTERKVLQAKPPWLKVPPPWGRRFSGVRNRLRACGLNTVCESARCPNIGECFGRGTATFLLLGGNCSRHCRFCNISSGPLLEPDRDEPLRVATAVRDLGLSFAVVTSVTRDDLPDGGSGHFARTVRFIKELCPETGIEVLIPDFQGRADDLRTVLDAGPDVINHNIETVSRLYDDVRPEADYERSLKLLERCAAWRPGKAPMVKSGFMVGLGESRAEVSGLIRDLSLAGVESLTIGQYLPPSPAHAPLARYVHPEEFVEMAQEARSLGIRHVFSAPLVRSSYMAEHYSDR